MELLAQTVYCSAARLSSKMTASFWCTRVLTVALGRWWSFCCRTKQIPTARIDGATRPSRSSSNHLPLLPDSSPALGTSILPFFSILLLPFFSILLPRFFSQGVFTYLLSRLSLVAAQCDKGGAGWWVVAGLTVGGARAGLVVAQVKGREDACRLRGRRGLHHHPPTTPTQEPSPVSNHAHTVGWPCQQAHPDGSCQQPHNHRLPRPVFGTPACRSESVSQAHHLPAEKNPASCSAPTRYLHWARSSHTPQYFHRAALRC